APSRSGARGSTRCRRRPGSSASPSPSRSCSSVPRPWCRTRSPAGAPSARRSMKASPATRPKASGPAPAAGGEEVPCRRRPRGGGRSGCQRRLAREGGDQLGGALRLVDGDERVAVLDQLQARRGESLRQALAVAQLEEAVLGRPRDQHGLVELAEALCSLQRVALVDALEDLRDLVPDLA